MSAVKNSEQHVVSMKDLLEIANLALRFQEMGPICGPIEYELVYEAEDRSSLFALDKEAIQLTFEPGIDAPPGLIDDTFVRFFYAEYPDQPTMDVKIRADVG